MAQLAVAWVLANPTVTAPIIGASRPDQLDDSVKALAQPLDADLKARLDELTSGYRHGRRRALTVRPDRDLRPWERRRAGARLRRNSPASLPAVGGDHGRSQSDPSPSRPAQLRRNRPATNGTGSAPAGGQW